MDRGQMLGVWVQEVKGQMLGVRGQRTYAAGVEAGTTRAAVAAAAPAPAAETAIATAPGVLGTDGGG